MGLTASILSKATGMTTDLAAKWADPLETVFHRYQVNTPRRQAHFLSQYGHETGGFLIRNLEENGMYSAERILEIFPNYVKDLADAKTLEMRPVALFNRVYGGRMGNLHEGSGDGYRFRGRGLPHLTGRDNYHACGQALSVNLLTEPDKLLQPTWAALVGGWFWDRHGLNAVADLTDPRDFGLKFFDLLYLNGFHGHSLGLAVDENLAPEDIRKTALGLPGAPDPAVLAEELQDLQDVTKKVNGGQNGLVDRIKRFERAMEALS